MATETHIHADKIERQLSAMAHDYRAYFRWSEDRIAEAVSIARAKMIAQAKDAGPLRIRYRIGGAPINEHSTLNYAQQGISQF